MNTLAEALPSLRRPNWPLAASLTLGVMLVLTGLFWPTLHSMIEIWGSSPNYSYGYLVFVVSALLIWRIRDELVQIRPSPDLRGMIVLLLAGAAWLLGDAGSVNVVKQYAFVIMLIASVWTLLGWTFFWAAFFPLMFLLFLVPVGEFLIPPLMDVTADLTVAMLQLTGIPVYREGNFFSIPSGNWSVVEGCAGLRFLIASLILGILFAYMSYRGWKKRVLFMLAATVVPILANGGRAYVIVMVAHLSDGKLGLGADHYFYGWVFFYVAMALMFVVGSFWRDDDRSESVPVPTVIDETSRTRNRPIVPVAVLVLLTSAVWPAYAFWLGQRSLPQAPDLRVEANEGWQVRDSFTTWVPHWVGADRQFGQNYSRDGASVYLELNYYVTQRQQAELVSTQNFMIPHMDPVWSNVGEARVEVEIAGESRKVRQAKMRGKDGQRLLVWQWNLVNQQPTVNDHWAKLLLALDRVTLKRDDGLSVLIATPYEDNTDLPAAAETLARFAADMEPAIARTLDQVDGP